ncbi:MAG: hypothetical protein SF162_09495 [bacterium]|nr:hypothetical protein [bacterium]
MSGNAVRISMYVIAIIVGIIGIIVGATSSDPMTRRGFIAIGATILLNGIYAWIRGLGPADPPDRPGWRFDFWPDGVVIIAIGAVCFLVAFLAIP